MRTIHNNLQQVAAKREDVILDASTFEASNMDSIVSEANVCTGDVIIKNPHLLTNSDLKDIASYLEDAVVFDFLGLSQNKK